MKALKPPLGIIVDSAASSIAQSAQLQREILRMGIRLDPDGYVHYHELLFRVMKRLYGSHLLHLDLDMQLYELITLQKV